MIKGLMDQLEKVELINLLENKKLQLKEDMEQLENQDPVFTNITVSTALDYGDENLEADTHNRIQAIHADLLKDYKNLESALIRYAKGQGKDCQKCGMKISSERIKAIPTTNYCIGCALKMSSL